MSEMGRTSPSRVPRPASALPESGPKARWGGWLPLPASQRQGGAVTQHELGAPTMEITTVGLDLAKNVFQVHAIGSTGGVVARRSLRRAQVIPFFSKLPPCLIGMEACGTSHHWARELVGLVRGNHQGQRFMPRKQAGHKTAPDQRAKPSQIPCNAGAIHTGRSFRTGAPPARGPTRTTSVGHYLAETTKPRRSRGFAFLIPYRGAGPRSPSLPCPP